jgi:N-acylneuraminate cytidylyltransferase/CMP-N,N'-diacetyllegionaminic acid synthase
MIGADGIYLKPFLPSSFTGFEEPHNLPRQFFPKVYMQTGGMDVMRLQTIRELKSTSGKKLGYFTIPQEELVDIDHTMDFELAEVILRKRLEERSREG